MADVTFTVDGKKLTAPAGTLLIEACREGTDWLKKTLTRFHAGAGVAKDIDNIRYLAQNMLGRTFCPLGDAAAMPTIAFVDKFRKEFEDHLDCKPCPYAGLHQEVLANA